MFNKCAIALFVLVACGIFAWNGSLEARGCCGPRVSINFGALFCPPPPPCPIYQETYICTPYPPCYGYPEPVCYPCRPVVRERVVIYNTPCRPCYPCYGW